MTTSTSTSHSRVSSFWRALTLAAANEKPLDIFSDSPAETQSEPPIRNETHSTFDHFSSRVFNSDDESMEWERDYAAPTMTNLGGNDLNMDPLLLDDDAQIVNEDESATPVDQKLYRTHSNKASQLASWISRVVKSGRNNSRGRDALNTEMVGYIAGEEELDAEVPLIVSAGQTLPSTSSSQRATPYRKDSPSKDIEAKLKEATNMRRSQYRVLSTSTPVTPLPSTARTSRKAPQGPITHAATPTRTRKRWYHEFVEDINEALTMSVRTRVIGFVLSFVLALCLLGASILLLTYSFIALVARIGIICYACGQVSFIASLFFLAGPMRQLKHALHWNRVLPCTVYLVALVLTVVGMMVFESVIFCFVMMGVQVLAFVWYVLTYIPGSTNVSRFALRTVWNFFWH